MHILKKLKLRHHSRACYTQAIVPTDSGEEPARASRCLPVCKKWNKEK
jgi:hypothetical protein